MNEINRYFENIKRDILSLKFAEEEKLEFIYDSLSLTISILSSLWIIIKIFVRDDERVTVC